MGPEPVTFSMRGLTNMVLCEDNSERKEAPTLTGSMGPSRRRSKQRDPDMGQRQALCDAGIFSVRSFDSV
jgi:hypothetical protein